MYCVPISQHELFQEYELPLVRGPGTEVRFKVNLGTLLECLAIYGPAALAVTSLIFAFSEEDGKLTLLLEESGVTTECVLSTADVGAGTETEDLDYDAAFRRRPVVAKSVITSNVLHDAVKTMVEQPGAKSVVFTMSPEAPWFRMHTASSHGAATMDVAANSDAFISFDCRAPAAHCYYLPLLQSCLRALASSETSFVRMNSVGMLHIANKVVTDSSECGVGVGPNDVGCACRCVSGEDCSSAPNS